MTPCDHYWTTTSECPRCLREALDTAEKELDKVAKLRNALSRMVNEATRATLSDNIPKTTPLEDALAVLKETL